MVPIIHLFGKECGKKFLHAYGACSAYSVLHDFVPAVLETVISSALEHLPTMIGSLRPGPLFLHPKPRKVCDVSAGEEFDAV